MDALLLYALPVALRAGLAPAWPGADRVALSFLPLLVVAPTPWLPCWIADEKHEHVVRHAVYTLAFGVGAASAVRWDVVAPAVAAGEAWAAPLVAYLAVGTFALAWFTLSHVLENARLLPLYTHQGDIAVLPLTLVAIATFAEAVPDEAFQFSRAVIFYVPVIVAWATLMFIAFTEFATSATTTHTHPAFEFVAQAGLVVGTVHLALLEARAPPLAFQVFPVVAALLCQLTVRHADAPARAWRPRLVRAATAAGAGTALGAAWATRFPPGLSYGIAVYLCVTFALALRPLAGPGRWVVPGAALAALISAAAFAPTLRPVDAAVLPLGYYAAMHVTALVAP